MKKVFRLLVLIACLGSSAQMGATHLAGYDIQYTCINQVQSLYQVTVKLYTDGCGIPPPSSLTISLRSGCGQASQITLIAGATIDVTPVCYNFQNQTCCHGGALTCFLQTIYMDTVNLSGCNTWTLSAQDCCRNHAINNLEDPGTAAIYIETIYSAAQTYPCNTSVAFDRQPIIYSCPNQLVNYNPHATDIDGDSLAFRFVTPRDGQYDTTVFLAPFTLAHPFPLDTLIMDSHTGMLSFTPTLSGNYVIGIVVDEYRDGILVGSSSRDMQILILPANFCAQVSQPPVAVVDSIVGANYEPNVFGTDFWVCPGMDLSFSFEITDPEHDSISFFNDFENQPNINFSYSQNPNGDTISGQVIINTSTFLQGEDYTFLLSVTDTNCPINNALSHYFYIHTADLHAFSDHHELCLGNNTEVHLSSADLGNFNQPFTYSWVPTTGLDDSTAQNPIAHISHPVTYVVSYHSGNCLLQDSVTIGAAPGSLVFPSDSVAAFVCIGDSVQLTPLLGESFTLSFENNDTTVVPAGTFRDIPLFVQGLPTYLLSGQLASVCVDIGIPVTNQLNIYLRAPDGTIVILSAANGGFGNAGYRNTCFDPLAAVSIMNYQFLTIPPNLQASPEDVVGFNNLNGHIANGTWNLRVQAAVNNGSAALFKYVSLTFNTYSTPTLHWEPQSGLNCYDCPSPTAYVTQATTWEVTASNIYGCLDTFQCSLTPILDTSLCDSLVIPPVWVPRGGTPPVITNSPIATTLPAQPRLYPNPANQQVILEMDGPLRPGTVTFSNVMGQSLLTGGITQQRNAYDVSGLPPGVYFVNVRYADGGNWVGRLVVGR